MTAELSKHKCLLEGNFTGMKFLLNGSSNVEDDINGVYQSESITV